MPKPCLLPSFALIVFVWHFAPQFLLLCSAPNPMGNLSLNKSATPIFSKSPKFGAQTKSKEKQISAESAKSVPIRRHASSTSIKIAPMSPVEAVEQKHQSLKGIEMLKVPSKNWQQNATSSSNNLAKCSLNECLDAVVAAHGVYHRVPAKTIAKIALNLLTAVMSCPNGASHIDRLGIDGILTFDRFSTTCPLGLQFDADELSDNLHFELNEAAKTVMDPRDRATPVDQQRENQRPIEWLKDVLFMSPEQIKEHRHHTMAKDVVWFIGLLLYRVLFNGKHPMDTWEPKRHLDVQFMAKTAVSELGHFKMNKLADFVPGDFGIRPLKPMDRWQWMPDNGRDETGEMRVVEQLIGIEQAYIAQLRRIVTDSLQNMQPMDFNYSRFASDKECIKKLIQLTQLCLQPFAYNRISPVFLRQILAQMTAADK